MQIHPFNSKMEAQRRREIRAELKSPLGIYASISHRAQQPNVAKGRSTRCLRQGFLQGLPTRLPRFSHQEPLSSTYSCRSLNKDDGGGAMIFSRMLPCQLDSTVCLLVTSRSALLFPPFEMLQFSLSKVPALTSLSSSYLH